MDEGNQLQNFRRAYGLLANRARISMAAQVQNPLGLETLRGDVLRFAAAAEPVRSCSDYWDANLQ